MKIRMVICQVCGKRLSRKELRKRKRTKRGSTQLSKLILTTLDYSYFSRSATALKTRKIFLVLSWTLQLVHYSVVVLNRNLVEKVTENVLSDFGRSISNYFIDFIDYLNLIEWLQLGNFDRGKEKD